MLTDKKRAFALAVHAGAREADAYRSAYDAENMKAATIRKRASELMRDGDVAGMLAELRQETAERALVTADMVIERAWAIAMQDKGDRTAALTILARLFPEFSEKHQVHTTVDEVKRIYVGVRVEEV